MIDDERLQELLSKASSLYNNGEYKGAIEAWQEALSVDPASQKAREGIRMATLLLGDFDAPGPTAPADEAEAPADGGVTSPEGLPPEELEARLDLGIARIKQLMAERKYAEAIEGAQGLQPLKPESEEIQRLLEEAQQAFEAAPFIEEHLTLARELLEQERFPEAEEECKKIFALDATHPRGRALLAEIKSGTQKSLERAASQLGGMTVKLNLADVMKKDGGAAAVTPKPPMARAGAARGGPAARRAAPDPRAESLAEEVILDAGDEPPIALARSPGGTGPGGAEEIPAPDAAGLEPGPLDALSPTDGEAARAQEEVASRSLLDDAFAQAGVGEGPPAGSPATVEGPGGAMAGAGHEAPAAATPPEEMVEARTVVKPTVRTAPAAPPKTAPARSKPDLPRADAGTAAAPAAPPAPAAEGVADWEKELTQLNLKVGEREMLKGTGARAAATAAEGAEADLMSLLDTDLGGPAGAPGEGGGAGNVQSIPLAGPAAAPAAAADAGKGKAPASEKKAAPTWTVKKTREVLAAEAAAEAAVHERPRERRRPVQVVVRRRSSAGRWLFLLLLLAAGGGGAWWFYLRPGATGLPPEITGLLSYLRPGAAGGAGSPQQPVAPPAGSSSGVAADAGQGPIPTPIGGPSRPAAQDGQGSAADGGGEPAGGARGAAGEASPGQASDTASVAAPAPRPSKLEPIKPTGTPVPLSPAEIRRRLAYYSSDGRRLMSQGKLREARAKFNAALALDPANFELKELVDQVQSKIDEEQHLLDDFESAKQFFNDRDYENALRKLYRLPRDKGLGDIDLYIRNAWYNWAVIAAKGGNATDTLKKLQELLEVDPDDADAIKLQEVAEHYLSRAKDRVYYAFAEKLRLRAIDQR